MLGIFLDTETNGLNSYKHSVLEIAYKIVDVKCGTTLSTYDSVLICDEKTWQQSDPNSLLVNGFTWDMVVEGKPKELVASEIIADFKQWKIDRSSAVFICQNPAFDKAFFSQIINPDLQEKCNWPYHWLDLASMFWVKQIRGPRFPWQIGISKDQIADHEKIAPEEKPHRAMNGVDHLYQCYEAVVGFPAVAIK